MASWSTKRRFAYGGGVFLVIAAIVGTTSYFHFKKAPNCLDMIKNGDEQGIDCGGSCTLMCPFQVVAPIVLWQRAAQISDGIYSVIAYVENPNPQSSASNIPYVFKLYDEQGIAITERAGQASLPANSIVPIFESGLLAGKRAPARVTFQFNADPVWVKASPLPKNLLVKNIALSKASSTPRIDASLQNLSVQPASHVQAVAIVYDSSGNAMAFSSTAVDFIAAESTQNIVFTWRQPFALPVSKIEIIPLLTR